MQKCNLADLIEVRNGGVPGTNGTWCRDYRIALRFAQWLSPEFSIKVDEAILGLLTASRGQAQLRRDESPAGAAGCDRGAMGASAPGGLLLRGRVYPKDRSAELGAFYAELRKWVLKEDEAAVAELAGVSPGHVAEVLAGRKPGYGVLCLLVEYATENRAAGRRRVVRSAARRAEQVEELRLDFMARLVPETNGMSASADMRQTNPLRTGASAELRRDESVMRRDESRLYEGGEMAQAGATGASAGKLPSTGDAMTGCDRGAMGASATDSQGVIDFNGKED